MNWWFIITTIISIYIIGLFIQSLLVPSWIKYLIRDKVNDACYDHLNIAKVHTNYTLYSNGKNKNLIVIFMGGAFLFNDVCTHYGLANRIYENMQDNYDVAVLKYPVRFQNTLHDSMLCINNSLTELLTYDSYHAIGVSSGALLAGTFIQKESSKITSAQIKLPQIGISFKSFVGLSGLYETTFDKKILTDLFSFYILKNTPNAQLYSCYGINIPRLLISSKNDTLFAQTTKYLQRETCERHIYHEILPHTFVQLLNLPQALDAIDRACKFIRKH